MVVDDTGVADTFSLFTITIFHYHRATYEIALLVELLDLLPELPIINTRRSFFCTEIVFF